MPDIAGKVALITGASSGIGKGTAEYFASLHCKLALAGRDEANLQQTKNSCLAAGLQDKDVLAVKADMTKESDLQNLAKSTIENFGKLDILVNCAGIGVMGAVENSPIEDYDRVMDINVRGVIILTKLCIPHIVATKGSIVNVSSVNGPCAFPGVTYYCMSKAALDQFTKCLALELAPQGVRVNSVNPGVIVTNVHRRMGQTDEQYAAFLEHSKTTHALGRVGDVTEVANAIGFLASDDASFTTGHLLRIDGGRGIMAPR